MKRFLLFTLFLLFSILLNSQNFQIIRQDSYGGYDYEELKCILKSNEGGYLIGASSQSEPSGNKTAPCYGFTDLWILKIDNNFNIKWQKSYGGTHGDKIGGVVQDLNNNYYIGGNIVTYNNGEAGGNITAETLGYSSLLVVKLDAQGNEIWQKSYKGNSYDFMYDMVIGNDKIYLISVSDSDIGGDKTENCRGDFDYWIVCIDLDGNIIWDKTIGGTKWEGVSSACLDANNEFLYVLGSSKSDSGFEKTQDNYDSDCSDLWLVKINCQDASIVADKTFGCLLGDGAGKIIFYKNHLYVSASNSNCEAGGDKTENGKGASDAWIVKLDTDLNIIWDKTIGGSGEDNLLNITATDKDEFILFGSSNSPVSFDKTEPVLSSWVDEIGNTNYIHDYWVVAIDNEANILWDKTIGSFGWEYGQAVIYNEVNSSIIVGGCSTGGISGDKTTINHGQAYGYAYSEDVWLVEMSIPSEIPSILNDNFSIFPNPATNILHFSEAKTYKILDIQGRVLMQSSTERNSVNISELSEGMYFIKFEDKLCKFVKN